MTRVACSLVCAGEEPPAEEQPAAAPSLPSEPVVLEATSEDAIAESAAPTTNDASGATETEAVEIDAVLERELPTAPAPPPEDVALTDDSLKSPAGDTSPTVEEKSTTVEAVVEPRGAEEPAVIVDVVATETAEETVDAEPEAEAEVVTGEDKNACTGERSTGTRHLMSFKQAFRVR